ncbi:MAG: elongation factor G, partial [Patescibacteria group bacterium]|nr:elongation factor G [Patescibacteria group bacterium]
HHELFEKLADHDGALMDKFVHEDEPEVEELRRAIRRATLSGEGVPVLCGSAFKNKAIQPLLDAIVAYLPSPVEVSPVEGHTPSGEPAQRKPDDIEPFSGLAFKIMSDPYVGKLTFFRVYSGTLESGSYVYNSTRDVKERVGRIVRLHANQREEVKEVFAGTIAAMVGLKDTKTGDTLCDPLHPVILEKITFPEPVISMRIEPKTKHDQEKMGLALRKLGDEDPTFRISTDEETLETIISGMGELHLEIIVDRMRREFSVEATTGKPQVAYKETITGESEAEAKYIRQTGGHGQYGHVKLRLRPIAEPEEGKKQPKNIHREEGYEFINSIKGAIIPNEFIPAVRKGVREAMDRGILAGFPVVNISCELYDGSYHEVDSSEIAFKIAGSQAFQEAAKRARPVLLEPIMRVEVVTPEKFLGDITGNLSSKRGQINAMEERGTMRVVKAQAPLAELFGYVTTLRSLTQGQASPNIEFDHYAIVPPNVAQTIIDARK